jgi:hypothetical protein
VTSSGAGTAGAGTNVTARPVSSATSRLAASGAFSSGSMCPPGIISLPNKGCRIRPSRQPPSSLLKTKVLAVGCLMVT